MAVTTFPAGCNPQVPVSDRRYYPIYQTCIDLDIPIVANAGIAGPRVPSECQNVMHFDQVCYDFPELRIVMRHGAEPWEDAGGQAHAQVARAVLHDRPRSRRSTTRRRSSTTPTPAVADKIMYAGYYPMGLDLDRIFAELPDVPFRDHVWPTFLRENAVRVFKLESAAHERDSAAFPTPGSVHDEQRDRRPSSRFCRAGPRPCGSARTSGNSSGRSPSSSASAGASCATPGPPRFTWPSSCSGSRRGTRSSPRRSPSRPTSPLWSVPAWSRPLSTSSPTPTTSTWTA